MATEPPTGPHTPAWKFAYDHNFVPDPHTVFEDMGPVNDEEVIRLCNGPDSTAIYILYEPDY